MKKQFFSALLCGSVVLSAGMAISCDNQFDDLSSRVTVLEGYITEIKAQLGKALTTGASIVSATQDDSGAWKFVLSDGQEINIKASAGGGSNVSVTQGEGSFTITVNGDSYTIPTGAKVNSLVYVPEYADGKVILGNDGAKVKLLATPAMSADDVSNAEFDIAVAEELKTRAGGRLLKVQSAAVDGGFVVVELKGLSVEAGKSYAVAISVSTGGTVISSDCFTVEVAADFSFEAENLSGVTIKDEYKPAALADGFMSMTVLGRKLLEEGLDFKTFFSELPEGAIFEVAPSSDQPGGKAQEKYALLKNSLAEDGAFAFVERPGTSFNDNTETPGFLVYVLTEDVVRAKVYVKINDELAGLEEALEAGRTGNFEAEWGGREKFLEVGANEIDICKVMTEYETSFGTTESIIHNGRETWFPMFAEYNVANANEDVIIFNDGGKLKMGELATEYAKGSRGITWFYRGFAVYVPEALGDENGKYIDESGEFNASDGYGVDNWLGSYVEYMADPEAFYASTKKWGITVDPKTGVFKTSDSYKGWGMRVAIGLCFEYAYGLYDLYGKDADQCGMIFFNRRLCPEGTVMPLDIKKQ